MEASEEIALGERFAFGDNWRRFLDHIDDARVERATDDLSRFVGPLEGATFLDVGSGSGLSSLAALRLGAAAVTSFDFDPESVAVTRDMRRRHAPDPLWTVHHGSALDEEFLGSLGTFDVVYSWGVLHHTGAMWTAIEQVSRLVRPNGRLALALYNYVPGSTERWIAVKRRYNRSGPLVRRMILAGSVVRLWGPTVARDLVRRRSPLASWRELEATQPRGMSPMTDVVDWVGGFPYEAATPDEVERRVRAFGFGGGLTSLNRGHGCSEYLFSSSR